MWQVFIVMVAFTTYYTLTIPIIELYKSNNTHRTYEACITKERAHKKKLIEEEEKEEQ
jgi:hypothetical protein